MRKNTLRRKKLMEKMKLMKQADQIKKIAAIHCPAGSAAAQYADAMGIPWVEE